MTIGLDTIAGLKHSLIETMREMFEDDDRPERQWATVAVTDSGFEDAEERIEEHFAAKQPPVPTGQVLRDEYDLLAQRFLMDAGRGEGDPMPLWEQLIKNGIHRPDAACFYVVFRGDHEHARSAWRVTDYFACRTHRYALEDMCYKADSSDFEFEADAYYSIMQDAGHYDALNDYGNDSSRAEFDGVPLGQLLAEREQRQLEEHLSWYDDQDDGTPAMLAAEENLPDETEDVIGAFTGRTRPVCKAHAKHNVLFFATGSPSGLTIGLHRSAMLGGPRHNVPKILTVLGHPVFGPPQRTAMRAVNERRTSRCWKDQRRDRHHDHRRPRLVSGDQPQVKRLSPMMLNAFIRELRHHDY